MSHSTKAETFAKMIMDAERRRDYSDYAEIMSEIVSDNEYLEILSDLAEQLPSGAFRNFFLRNLASFAMFGSDGFRNLYDLCRGKRLALYSLTWCLVTIGRIRGPKLRELCGGCSEVERIEQFESIFHEDIAPTEDERLFERYYKKVFGVSKDEILSFRRALASR